MKTSKHELSIGAPFSYVLSGNKIIIMIFWVFPVGSIKLEYLDYLRLASPIETPWYFHLLNLDRLLIHQRSHNPVYILRTRSGRRFFMAMDSGSHFRLRQIIGELAMERGRRQR